MASAQLHCRMHSLVEACWIITKLHHALIGELTEPNLATHSTLISASSDPQTFCSSLQAAELPMSRMVPASPFSSVNPTEAPSFAGGPGRTNVNNILRATHRSAGGRRYHHLAQCCWVPCTSRDGATCSSSVVAVACLRHHCTLSARPSLPSQHVTCHSTVSRPLFHQFRLQIARGDVVLASTSFFSNLFHSVGQLLLPWRRTC